MKLIIAFAVIGCFTTLCADTWTDPDTGINWTYTLIDEGVSLGDGFYGPPAVPGTTKGGLIIPDKIKGKSVVSIGDYAFAGCAALTSVTIPNGVRSIGACAFGTCLGLTSVMIPSTVSSIGEAAFSSCNALKSVSIPSSVTKVGMMAFCGCYELSSVTISEGVQCVDDYAFDGCSGLTVLNIPATVTRVGKNAFNGCEKLRSYGVIVIDGCLVDVGNVSGAFTIPTGVRLVADAVFEGCSGFASLTIPATVTSVGRRAFGAWQGLLAIDFEGAPPTGVVDAAINQDAVVRYNSQYANDWLPVIAQCGWPNASPYTLGTPTDPVEYKQPDGGPYQEIVDGVVWTFKVSDGIAAVTGASPSEGSLTVPAGLGGRPVANIGDSAFLRCRGLTAVTIPSGVTRIGDSAFYECSSLASVKMPNTLTHIGVNAFNSCKMLSQADVPPNVTSIGNSAFYDCCRLDALEIPATMTSIGKSVFSGCYGLESVVIPSSVTNVSYSAFEGCWGLKRVTIPACVAGSRLSYTFRDAYTEIEEVVICDGATRIGWAAFEDCSCLASVTVPSTVTCIDNYAFEYCSRLTALSIPSGVTNIGEHAFWNCEGLYSVTIPAKLMHIGKSAFFGCKGLEFVNISDLAAWCGIEFEGEDANPLSEAGHLYLNGQEVVTLTLPSGVERIGDYAFIRCLDLSSVTIPGGVKSIGCKAFEWCEALKAIDFEGPPPDGVDAASIDKTATICYNAAYADEWSKVVSACGWSNAIPYVPGEPKPDGGPYTETCDGATWKYVVRDGCAVVDADNWYATAAVSKMTTDAITIPLTLGGCPVTGIGDYAFYYCNGLKAVTIPSGVLDVGKYAFAYCRELTSVTIPEGITNIGDNAFNGCVGLTAVTIPASVSSIGESAFSYCTGLTSVMIPFGVKSVGNNAFYECAELTSVFIPRSLSSIGWNAFGYRVCVVYVEKGDVDRVKTIYGWSGDVTFIEVVQPSVEGDPSAAVTGDLANGFVIKPSADKLAIEVTIPQGVDAVKVTVEVSPKVATVKPNGAKVKVVVGNNDITDYLVIPENDGVLNVAAATVKEEIVKETLDPSKDAVIEMNAANPRLATAPTRKGLTYTLYEGRELKSLSKGDTKLGDGNPWEPEIKVSGGNAAFYSIDVSK